jgi:polyisoprenoid-binding protein YceI
LNTSFERNMDKQRNGFKKYESKFDRKAKMAERRQFRETLEKARLNTDTDYLDEDLYSDDWKQQSQE